MFNTDRASRKAYPTLKQALADVFDYIERFYNDIFHRHLYASGQPILNRMNRL